MEYLIRIEISHDSNLKIAIKLNLQESYLNVAEQYEEFNHYI